MSKQQEQEIKELVEKIFKFMYPAEKMRVGNNRTDYTISLAKSLISSGYVNINNIKLTEIEQKDTEYKGRGGYFDGYNSGYNAGSNDQLAHNLKQLKGE